MEYEGDSPFSTFYTPYSESGISLGIEDSSCFFSDLAATFFSEKGERKDWIGGESTPRMGGIEVDSNLANFIS